MSAQSTRQLPELKPEPVAETPISEKRLSQCSISGAMTVPGSRNSRIMQTPETKRSHISSLPKKDFRRDLVPQMLDPYAYVVYDCGALHHCWGHKHTKVNNQSLY